MRPTRVVLTAATIALAPALFLSTPSFAAEATPPSVTAPTASDPSSPYDTMSEEDLRIAILRILASPDTGKAVHREADKALDGTVEDMRAFLTTGYHLAQAEDDRVAIVTILAKPESGKAVHREADKALDNGTPEALRAFLTTGYRLAQAEDDRVAIVTILAKPDTSPALRAAATRALDDGSPEALRHFLEVGQYEVDG
ncbi:ALF repeat-containing protein [Streptomyces sp. NPDC015220]|uniref:ALF repeat-containing protein n=1 Tax=Streptomyces sp. NPDC015220 TaxID=3364947 RepID=UPI003702D9B7